MLWPKICSLGSVLDFWLEMAVKIFAHLLIHPGGFYLLPFPTAKS